MLNDDHAGRRGVRISGCAVFEHQEPLAVRGHVIRSWRATRSSVARTIKSVPIVGPDQLFSPAGSDVVLDTPGPGNNKAFGNCSLSLGVCTFSGGTGKFTGFDASVDVSPPTSEDPINWHWDETYSFGPQD